MEVTFLGGASEVGASSTLLQVAGHCLLIDGGMRPAAREGQSRLPDLSLLDASPPEAFLITHAHIDHTGALPLIASLFPHIPIYATESTRVLTEILLRDSVKIMEQEGLKPDGETPLYTTEQVDNLLSRIQPVGFRQPFAPLTDLPALTVRYLPAGHILGAAMLFFETPEGTLLHTGDISVTDQRTIKGLDLHALPQADVMICEGTYGSRAHTNRKEEERKLAETVQATLERSGRVLLPTFAVGRSQEIVLILKAYRASNQISPVPVYLDGMVRSVCTAYQNQSHDLHPSLQRFLANARRPLFADPDLDIFAVRSQDREGLTRRKAPMIIISSSGMLSGGASPLYAAQLATSERDAIIFSGYQDEESPGAALLQAKQGSTIRLGTERLMLSCQVERYNLSGHADGEQIVHTVTKVAPTRLILVHGAPEALETLARRFSKIAVDIPTVGTTITFAPVGRSRPTSNVASGSASSPDPASPDAAPPSQPVQEQKAPPTIEDLWEMAYARGPSRPWTAVELGQQYYGQFYSPQFRAQVERVLKGATPFFKQGRVGAQPTYLPRKPEEAEQLRPLTLLTPGDIVLAQGQQGTPQLALLLSAPEEGTCMMVSDQWKQGKRPMPLIQLVPGIRRDDLLAVSPEDARQKLIEWKRAIEQEWVDLLAWWKRCQGKPFMYAELCAKVESDELRLAWGIELLARGSSLFHRRGMSWLPVEAEKVTSDPGLVRHLALLDAGAGTPVLVNGQRGRLTGRSTWRLFEVEWEDGEQAGEHSGVRVANIVRER